MKMNNDTLTAREKMQAENCTCVLCKGGQYCTSTLRGVAPLVEFLESGESFRGFSTADRIVGRAAAFLYVLLGVREVYADVMSEGAAAIFEQYGISSFCEETAREIRNRAGTGICPMEEAVQQEHSPSPAFEKIKQKLVLLKDNRI